MLSHCPDSEELLAYYLNVSPAPDRFRTHNHLAHCDACVLRLLDMARTDAFLRYDELFADVPEEFSSKMAVSEQVKTPVVRSKLSQPCLAIRLARSSIQLLRDTLIPDLARIEWIPAMAPAMAFRSEETIPGKRLQIEHVLDERQMTLHLTPFDENQIDLEIRLAQSQQPMSGVRILLKDNLSILCSQKTDVFGKLVIPHIRPGQYRLQIPVRNIDWIINIQSELNSGTQG